MNIPHLGTGVVYVPGLEPLLEPGLSPITALEVEPATFWIHDPGLPERYQITEERLARIASWPQQKIVHGVGFPVGGSRPPDPLHLPLFGRVIDSLSARWASEHLGFNQAQQPEGLLNTRFFLPPLQTAAGVQAAAATIHSTADTLSVPFAFETGVNYLRPRHGEMSDGAFIAAVAETADCGILLDLHNIYTNERNGRQKVKDFLAEIPLDRVWELHLAGGFELDGYWLDAHSGLIPPEVMALAEDLVQELPNLGAIVFEILPAYVPQAGLDALRREVDRIDDLWEWRQRALPPPSLSMNNSIQNDNDCMIEPTQWEDTLGALALGRPGNGELAEELLQDPGVEIMRKLIWNSRAGDIAEHLPITTAHLIRHLGEISTRELLSGFFQIARPSAFAANEVLRFAEHLASISVDVPYLADILAYESAIVRAHAFNEKTTIKLPGEPRRFLAAIADGHAPPANDEHVVYEVEITP